MHECFIAAHLEQGPTCDSPSQLGRFVMFFKISIDNIKRLSSFDDLFVLVTLMVCQ